MGAIIRLLGAILSNLYTVVRNTQEILANTEKIMATQQEFADALAAVDAETTRIADYVQQLLEQLGQGGLTAEQEAEVLAKLNVATERLRGIGTSVENPVPVEPVLPS